MALKRKYLGLVVALVVVAGVAAAGDWRDGIEFDIVRRKPTYTQAVATPVWKGRPVPQSAFMAIRPGAVGRYPVEHPNTWAALASRLVEQQGAWIECETTSVIYPFGEPGGISWAPVGDSDAREGIYCGPCLFDAESEDEGILQTAQSTYKLSYSGWICDEAESAAALDILCNPESGVGEINGALDTLLADSGRGSIVIDDYTLRVDGYGWLSGSVCEPSQGMFRTATSSSAVYRDRENPCETTAFHSVEDVFWRVEASTGRGGLCVIPDCGGAIGHGDCTDGYQIKFGFPVRDDTGGLCGLELGGTMEDAWKMTARIYVLDRYLRTRCPDATPSPSPSPVTPTHTPEPTTAAPSPTHTPDPTHIYTRTPRPTPTPSGTRTPEPTVTIVPTPTPTPVGTATPTPTVPGLGEFDGCCDILLRDGTLVKGKRGEDGTFCWVCLQPGVTLPGNCPPGLWVQVKGLCPGDLAPLPLGGDYLDDEQVESLVGMGYASELGQAVIAFPDRLDATPESERVITLPVGENELELPVPEMPGWIKVLFTSAVLVGIVVAFVKAAMR